MMKKRYVKPQMEVVMINQRVNLLLNSYATTTSGNGGFNPVITGSDGQGRSRGCDWDEED